MLHASGLVCMLTLTADSSWGSHAGLTLRAPQADTVPLSWRESNRGMQLCTAHSSNGQAEWLTKPTRLWGSILAIFCSAVTAWILSKPLVVILH